MGWKARLLTGLMLVAMLMAVAGPAMAADKDRHENRHDRFENRFDRFNVDFDDCDFHDCDFEDNDFDEDFFLVPTLFTVEVDDIDCDGLDDDFDGLVDEDAVCVVDFDVDEID